MNSENNDEFVLKPRLLYGQWIDSLKSAGIHPISDDTCCKLLAILYVYGGDSEDFTHQYNLLLDIEYSMKRLNIDGAEIPNKELSELLRKYVNELQPQGWFGEREHPEWAVKLMKRYDIELEKFIY
jgi:hypothetical protein